MKQGLFFSVILALVLSACATTKTDDLYYEDDYVPDKPKDYEEDYAFEFTLRIKRFHEPTIQGMGYYDPCFIDAWWYDPYYSPGTSIYVIDHYWRPYPRWTCWDEPHYNNGWSWNFHATIGLRWNSWGSYSGNNYYCDPYWTWNGYNPFAHQSYYDWYGHHHNYGHGGNGGRHGPGWNYNWGHGHYSGHGSHHGDGGYQTKTYTGVRRHGSVVNPGYARTDGRSSRLAPAKQAPTVELKRPSNRRTQPDQPATERTSPVQREQRPAREETRPTGRGQRPVPHQETRPTGRGQRPVPRQEARPERRQEARPSGQPGKSYSPRGQSNGGNRQSASGQRGGNRSSGSSGHRGGNRPSGGGGRKH